VFRASRARSGAARRATMHEALPELSIEPLGESAFACQVGGAVTLDKQAWIWGFDEAVCSTIAGVETIVGMNNLTVLFDALSQPGDRIRAQLHDLWRGSRAVGKPGELLEIPVCYGGAAGPELPDVARQAGLSEEDVAQLHAQALYTVFFVGFQPGFAYLGELDRRLWTPRLAEPRLKVPAGSVGIGGNQTGIYPISAPGGWNLIGRTDRALFDASRSPPSLLRAGSRVRFVIERILPC
jgi:5-oxoprolinase (ATP-hydrolysing) subunit B